MKLYFSPGTCSLSPHIVLREAGLPFSLEKVDTKAGKTAGGADFKAINPKGYVPVLELDDGLALTEGAVIVQYLADQSPQANLAPKAGSHERLRMQELLNYIATEIHKGFGPLFNRKLTDDAKATLRGVLTAKFDYLVKLLGSRQFISGDQFSVADAYLFTVLNWSGHAGIELSGWPALADYHKRIGARPAVRAALEAEGLLRS